MATDTQKRYWITAPIEAELEIRSLGIRIGSTFLGVDDDGYPAEEFRNCEIPDTAWDQLDLKWGAWYWGPEKGSEEFP